MKELDWNIICRNNLKIRRVDPDLDIGEFRCVATNTSSGMSKVSQGVRLNIKCKLKSEQCKWWSSCRLLVKRLASLKWVRTATGISWIYWLCDLKLFPDCFVLR